VNDDKLTLVDDAPPVRSPRAPWSVLIVDDENEVHAVTELALHDFNFCGRGLSYLHAYSGAEARDVLRRNPNIALILLDVVMETERAGLDLVQFVREELHNPFVRIVLRTGQPGQAPEMDVITRYDINDYKQKTELTRERLFTTVYTGLSVYRDLRALDANRHGLEKVIEASARIFELRSIERFTQGVLEQLTALLYLDNDAVMLQASGLAAMHKFTDLRIIAATGAFAEMVGRSAGDVLPAGVLERMDQARRAHAPVYGPDFFAGYYAGTDDLLFYVGADNPLEIPDRRLIELFCRNVAIARENLRLLALDHRPPP
jgi:CheY-like chemotaxis protein